MSSKKSQAKFTENMGLPVISLDFRSIKHFTIA